MTLSVLIQQILIIFMEIGIGLTAAKCGIIKESDSKFLSNLVMSVTLRVPCLPEPTSPAAERRYF